jgi:hypothetical protein
MKGTSTLREIFNWERFFQSAEMVFSYTCIFVRAGESLPGGFKYFVLKRNVRPSFTSILRCLPSSAIHYSCVTKLQFSQRLPFSTFWLHSLHFYHLYSLLIEVRVCLNIKKDKKYHNIMFDLRKKLI